jgi:DNA helicase-2/ATP-dependent DNA helicase PcrA
MEKTVIAPDDAKQGAPVRVLRGNMRELATICAAELAAFGYGGDAPPVESAAILSWSTSEDGTRPVAVLRSALEPDIRVYNPRAKTAAKRGSALSDLLGILSYMVDPITVEPVGANGRRVEVWAQHNRHSASAATIPPPFPENDDHTDFQKWFRKPEPRSPISPTTPEKQDILDYIDHIKLELATRGRQYTRLTLSGLIARVLSFPFFANSGFTVQLLRQALFTQLYEAYVLPTRQTMSPLDSTLEVELQNGKWVWPDRYWRFMGVFASVLKNISVDDPESEAFEEGAVPVITFHQAKGLEFDHVYVIGGGRQVETRSALTNMLFSGVAVPISMKEALTDSTDPQVLIQAQADADREFYVAISRPKRSLTVLSANDEKDIPDYAREHPAVTRVVSAGNYPIRQQGAVMVIEIAYA